MVVVGYDDSKNAFKLVNSWGQNWSDRGFGWIDYSFFYQVVREGYVARDLPNAAPPSPSPVPGPPPVNPPSPAPVPAPVPVQPAPPGFVLNGVQHNVPDPALGPGMRFSGTVTVPPGTQGNLQVVIQIVWNANGVPGPAVLSLNPAFALPNGAAATGTPLLNIPVSGVQTTWTAFLPYYSLRIARGVAFGPLGPVGTPIQSNLIAVPALFINNFTVAQPPPVPFFVRL